MAVGARLATGRTRLAAGVVLGVLAMDRTQVLGVLHHLHVLVMNMAAALALGAPARLLLLGLGVDPLIPSWGGMLADGRTYMQTAWWVSVFPGVAIMLTVLGLNLLGDWLRDRIDPTGKL